MNVPLTAEPGTPLVIVPCGVRKRSDPLLPAGELYTGSYHLSCRQAAAALTTPDRTLILSALYGLLPLDQVIAPYELRMGQPGSITTGQLRRQAVEHGLVDERHVIILGGRDYTAAALAVWPYATTPLAGTGGMFRQRAVLAEIARAGLAVAR